MPLMTRRSSTRSMPRTSVGRRGSIRFHCSSFSQNRFLRTIPIPSKNEPGSYCQSGKLMSSDPSSEPTKARSPAMMKRERFAIAKIYVPVKRRATLDPKKAQEIAESILQVGLQSPILVRQDGERFVLVEGLHRLEACKQLGEETIVGYVVQARQH